MRIAVSVKEPSIDSEVDPRFGRAPYFLLVDTDTMEWEVVCNTQNLNLTQGAGIQAAQSLMSKSPQVLLTGNCGPKAFRVFEAAGVKVCVGVKGTARDAVEDFIKGKYIPAKGPNVEGHWI
jgi:predicted Fe-Mo cluster-binding NifX family protein